MLRIVSWGSLVGDPRFFRQQTHGTMPYPVGYTIERNVFSSLKGKGQIERTRVLFPDDDAADAHVADVYYTASIKQGPDGGPFFEVIRSDRPDVVHNADNPSAAWRSALEAAERDFPERVEELVRERRDAQGVLLLRGQKWFGLTFENVLAKLKTFFGASFLDEGRMSARYSLLGRKRSRSNSISATTPACTTFATSTVLVKTGKGTRSRTSMENPLNNDMTLESSLLKKKLRVNKKENKSERQNIIIDEDDIPISILGAGRALGITEPCQECGLKTMFCPMTGKSHADSQQQSPVAALAQRNKLGNLSRPTRNIDKTSKTTDKAMKRAGKKRLRNVEMDDGAVGAVGTVSDSALNASAGNTEPRKRMKKELPVEATTGRSKRQTQLKLSPQKNPSPSQDPDDVPLAMRLSVDMTKACKTPSPSLSALMWRPPLALPESQKAVQVLQNIIRAEKIIRAPFESLLNLPLVANAKPRTGRKKSDGNPTAERLEAESGNVIDEGVSVAAIKTEEKKNVEELRDHHPLDIVDVATSIAGRRYVKFMQQYTSERTKVDLLKKADAKAVKKSRSPISKDKDKIDETLLSADAANGECD